MASFNVCTFIGRVGTEPEQHESTEGMQVSKFRLAIDAPGKEKDTIWLTIVSFKKLAELVKSYVKKGALVAVNGRLVLENPVAVDKCMVRSPFARESRVEETQGSQTTRLRNAPQPDRPIE